MGCFQSKTDEVKVGAGKYRKKMLVTSGKAKKQQGVNELKANYNITLKSQRLGTGAFGSVFKTNNINDKSFEVAIKVLDKNKLKDDIELIMEEVAILNTIDHPNICNYYETYDDKKFIYLVMEYISGNTIFERIGAKEHYGEKKAAKYMKQLFQAINHCHAINIVHRDIKPENIMVNEDDEVRLIDFGLALITKKTINKAAGTPYYFAPEVITESYGSKADIWSLGVVLYQLVSGKRPFEA